jgi:uncharacterized membrane protein YbhN (UPF0104 family)
VKAFWTALTDAARLVAHANAGLIAIAFAIFLGSMVIVAFRWRQILAALGYRATIQDTLLTYSAGLCIGNITPARILGADAFRIAMIRSRTGATVRIATASIFYDRFSEVPAITILALFTLSRFRTYMWVVIGVVVALAALALTGAIRRAVSPRVAAWQETIVGVPVGRGNVAAAISWSLLLYLQDVTRIFLIALAFGVWLTPVQAATMSVVRLIGGAAPTPGGLGVVEGGQIGSLVLFGIPTETASAIVVVERAILYGCATAIGAVSLMLLGGRKALGTRAHADDPPSPPVLR